ncbi:MAG: prepilin-type N-terminal cleavage/methylation domain-containing protein [Bacilli bacterium]
MFVFFKKKNKGFTLIELLTVIIVLIIIVSIAVPNIMKVVNNSKERSYQLLIESIENSAQLYVSKDRKTVTDYLKDNEGESYKVTLKDLVGDGLLKDKIINPRSNEVISLTKGVLVMYSDKGSLLYCYEDKECPLPCEAPLPSPFPPKLDVGMIPIRWDDTQWVKADITKEWYDYDKQEWANVVLVKSEKRGYYKSAEAIGNPILEDDVLAYLVWIPRYRYQLFNVEFKGVNEVPKQTIEIEFESSTTNKVNGSTNGSWLTHPAFAFGENEITGFWIGKFETTGSEENPTVKPGKPSVRSINVSGLYAMNKLFETSSLYGLEDSDAHMLKNMEWGAVAYLSHSKYGKNAEITISGKPGYCTGGACDITAYSGNVGQSTTGNVYGVYDMSGGAYEYVMGGMYYSDNETINVSSSGFIQATIDGDTMAKYIDKYDYGRTYQSQDAYNRSFLGDATGETRGWYSDYAGFVYYDVYDSYDYSWFKRGGYFNSGSSAGVFYFESESGGVSNNCGSRLGVV